MIKLLCISLLSSMLCAGELLTLHPYKNNEFSPALKQEFKISFTLHEDAKVKIDIYTPDNNLIRTLQATMKKGEGFLIWDGKDNQKVVVPDEAYNIVVTAKDFNSTETIDFRTTGGEVIKKLYTKVDRLGNINFTLSEPSRVLIRAGIANSSMLRVISNWVPKNRGKIKQRWDMRDADNLVDVAQLDFSISISAYTLPKYAILTINNYKLDYFTYFKKAQMKCNNFPKEKQGLKQAEYSISKHFYKCRIKDRDPRLFVTMPHAPKDDQNISILKNSKSTLIKVSMHPEDEKIIEKSKYEVSFFIDFEFYSEEELGYMPISWNFTPNGLSKGNHILTVNVSSFTGQVGLKSYKFIIK